MQVKVSPELDRVLRDKDARDELRKLLRKGQGGRVTVGDTTYRVNTEVPGNKK